MTPASEHLAAARTLLDARQYGAAEARLGEIAETDPVFGQAISLRGMSAKARHDFSAAEAAGLRAIELNGENVADLSVLAAAYHGQRKFEEGVPAFQKLLTLLTNPREIRWAYQMLARCQVGLARLPDAEATIRASLEKFDEAAIWTDLAENLFQQKRLAEAADAAEEALSRDHAQLQARTLRNVLRHEKSETQLHQKWSPWPGRASAFSDARAIIQSSLLRGYPQGERFIRPSTRFMALGSCFAANLAKRMRQAGREVFYEFVGEEVNSTYANRYFLQWIENGPENETTQLMEDAFGSELRQRYLDAARDCDAFVFTLGVAPCFFHPDTGEFFFMNMTGITQSFLLSHFRQRMTNLEENARNLEIIIETIRRLCPNDPQIVLTVSPVPLAATAERESAVIADCLSKSTLRLACDQVMSGDTTGRLHYWPSFEVVRWLGPNFAGLQPPVYGAQDGKTRHVSPWIVDLIIDLFQETYSAETIDA